MRQAKVGVWAVYSKAMKGCPDGVRVVCRQDEWEALDRAKPGVNTLIEGNLTNEGQAERLARGRSGHTPSRAEREKARVEAWDVKGTYQAPLPV
jgi:hypothetical protein